MTVKRQPYQRGAMDPSSLESREWLVTNGLGGYASGSLAGGVTRRYHGLLVAALPAPLGRVMMFNRLIEEVKLDDNRLLPLDAAALVQFELQDGLPVWTFDAGRSTLEKRVVMPRGQNTVFVSYRLHGPRSLRLRLRPAVNFRPHSGRVDLPLDAPYTISSIGGEHEVHAGVFPPLRLRTEGSTVSFVIDSGTVLRQDYAVEKARGLEAAGDLWSPGYFRIDLAPGVAVALVGSVESWDTIRALSARSAFEAEHARRRRLVDMAAEPLREGFGAELVLAADAFIVTPATRPRENARAQAAGDDAVTVIAGYPWFTDWGRDTMISLEGLALLTGRHREATGILRTFSHMIRDGLIPNQFPEGEQDGIYNTADATLWYFQAVHAYVQATNDRSLLRSLLPRLQSIVDAHVRGTRFGIRMDPADGLMRQGEQGYALTWMDARMDSWIVTPRRGKAVEINALWYNALRLLDGWIRTEGAGGNDVGQLADRVRTSFNERFWFEKGRHCYDVVDGEEGDDPALRPNQIFAIALTHPVLDAARWEAVVEAVRTDLLCPVGQRTLSPAHRDYKPRYDGDLRRRDGAYHQGTVWPWLIGPYVDAWLRVHPEDLGGARKLLAGFNDHLSEGCVGTIGEIFDADPPFLPRGCFAQAWSVAEVLRAWVATAGLGGGTA